MSENFVFHFTGKGNQSYVMKDSNGEPVYEANCEKVTLFKDTPFTFRNHITGQDIPKMVGHTVSHDLKILGFGGTITSSFKIDGEHVWTVLDALGYGFHFYMQGASACFEITYNGEKIGHIGTAGTAAIDPSKAGNPLANVPTNGIYKVECDRDHIVGAFLLCFAVTKTEFSFKTLKSAFTRG